MVSQTEAAEGISLRAESRSDWAGNRLAWLSMAVIVVLTAFVYAPTAEFEFVNWDDYSYVTMNPIISGWSPENLAAVCTENVTRNYAPLTIFSYLLDRTFWGEDAGGYHLTNVALHLINGCLVWMLVRQLTRRTSVALLTAALFLLHPVQVESVAWVSARKGLLSACFMLLCGLVRLKPNPSTRDELTYTGLLAAALLAKALAVVVPPIILAWDVFVRRREFREALVAQIIPGLMACWLLLKTMGSQGAVLGGLRGHLDLPLTQIIAVDGTLIAAYARMLFVPDEFCILYNPPVTGVFVQVLLSWSVLLACGWWTWNRRSQNPLRIFSVTAGALLLLPVMNLTPITTLMNDRYLYLPCIPVFAGAALILQRLLGLLTRYRESAPRRASIVVGLTAVVLVSFAAIKTSARLPVWENSETLWADAAAKAPELAVVHLQRAFDAHDRGEKDLAVRYLQEGLRVSQPDAIDRARIQTALADWTVSEVRE